MKEELEKQFLEEQDRLERQFRRYALYTDLRELHAKIIPVVDGFREKMDDYKQDHFQLNNVIKGLDVALTTKANKTELLIMDDKKFNKTEL